MEIESEGALDLSSVPKRICLQRRKGDALKGRGVSALQEEAVKRSTAAYSYYIGQAGRKDPP